MSVFGKQSGESDIIDLRPERPSDYEGISAVVAAAFGSTAEARLVESIRASENFVPELSLVADVSGQIVGHVMISYVGLDGATGRATVPTLSPLAVAPSFQRRGVGSALVRAVTDEAERRGEPMVVLEGDPRYYGRFGLEYSVPYGIEITLPPWAQAEAAQLLRLQNYDPSLKGRVIYPAAFDEFSHD